MSKTVAKQSIILESKQSEYAYNVNRERRGEEGGGREREGRREGERRRQRDRQTDRQRLGKRERERRKCTDRDIGKETSQRVTHKETDRQYAPFIRKYISINEDTGLVQY